MVCAVQFKIMDPCAFLKQMHVNSSCGQSMKHRQGHVHCLPKKKHQTTKQPHLIQNHCPQSAYIFLSRPTKKELARREYTYRGSQKCSQVRGQVSRDVERFFHSVNDVERLRKGALLQRFSIWHGHVRARHSVHWSIQVVECRTFHDASADL